MVNENIQILGLENFDEKEKEKMFNLTESYYEKISRNVPGNLVLHAKKHEKDGNRHMYSFHAKIQLSNNIINVDGTDWVLSTALHKVLKKVENNIAHKFKNK